MTLADDYAEQIRPLLPLAKKAYGSRDSDTPNHAASREYTRLLVEFKTRGGHLTELSDKLGVAYSGMNRRVSTASLAPHNRTTRKRMPDETYVMAVEDLKAIRDSGDIASYHDAILAKYEQGLSMSKLARFMNISSSHPLYYGISRARLRQTTQN